MTPMTAIENDDAARERRAYMAQYYLDIKADPIRNVARKQRQNALRRARRKRAKVKVVLK